MIKSNKEKSSATLKWNKKWATYCDQYKSFKGRNSAQRMSKEMDQYEHDMGHTLAPIIIEQVDVETQAQYDEERQGAYNQMYYAFGLYAFGIYRNGIVWENGAISVWKYANESESMKYKYSSRLNKPGKKVQWYGYGAMSQNKFAKRYAKGKIQL